MYKEINCFVNKIEINFMLFIIQFKNFDVFFFQQATFIESRKKYDSNMKSFCELFFLFHFIFCINLYSQAMNEIQCCVAKNKIKL
jgi:hypothetical protein